MNQPAQAPAAEKPSHPPVPNFDTMKAMDALKQTGFDEPQAKGLVEFVRESQNRLATKEDLEKLRIELHGDMKTLGAELRADMSAGFKRMYGFILFAMGVFAAAAKWL